MLSFSETAFHPARLKLVANRCSMSAAVGLLWLSAAVAAFAADSSGDDVSGLAAVYAKKATWQETMLAAREALAARDAAWVAAGKGEAGMAPGVTFGTWWRLGPLTPPVLAGMTRVRTLYY